MKKLLLALLLFAVPAVGQISSKQIVFVTSDPTVCATNKLYANITTGDLFEALVGGGTTCTKIVNPSGAGISGAGTTNSIPKFTGVAAIGDANLTDDGTTQTVGKSTAASGLSASGGSTLIGDYLGNGNGTAIEINDDLSTVTVPALTVTTINGLGIASATGKALTINNTLTLAGTDSTTMTFPSVSASIPGLAVANVFTASQRISPLLGVGMTPVATLDITAPAATIGIQFIGTATAGVSSGNGTPASNAVSITGATGGATSDAGTNKTGGGGGAILLTGGIGGANTGAGSGGIARGGNGGAITLIGGLAGNSTAVTGTVKGGAGGSITTTGGNGGTSATAAGGQGGLLDLSGGTGGATSANAAGGAGGGVTINGGAGGTSSGGGSAGASGAVTIGSTSTSSVNIGAAAIPTVFGGVAQAAAFTVATLPTPTTGMYAYVTDGDTGLAWGATVVHTVGTTKYLVWYNGTNWTVAGK
jgi:hypothetical protein